MSEVVTFQDIEIATKEMESILIRTRVSDNLTGIMISIELGTEPARIMHSIEERERTISNNDFLIEKVVRCCRVFCEIYAWVYDSRIIKSIFEEEIENDAKLEKLNEKFSLIDLLVNISIFHQELKRDFLRSFGPITLPRLISFVERFISTDLTIFEIGSNKGFISSSLRLMGYHVRACDLDYFEGSESDKKYFTKPEEYDFDTISTSTENVLIVSANSLDLVEDINRFNGQIVCCILYEDQCESLINGLSNWDLINDGIIMSWSNVAKINYIHILHFNKK